MPIRTVNGDQALAYGALVGGVKIVTSYPGSPSSGTVEVLIENAREHELHVEWSSNEKVAVEIAIGASIAGRRALMCTKSVGMNVMLDPLMALNLTPVNGGLVILLGDDPGGYGSQNDQDTRPLALMLKMPMLEPASPAEGYAMMKEAFALSERLATAVIIRETRSFTQQVDSVEIPQGPYHQPNRSLMREPWRFVPVPKNVVEKNRALNERVKSFVAWAESAPFNKASGIGGKGVIAAGFVYRKLLDVIGDESRQDLRLLKLATLYPLPEKLVGGFLSDCHEVLLLEENEPYVETQIKAIAYDHDCHTKIFGKQSHHVNREGELFRWQIQRALSLFLPSFVPARSYVAENEVDERPHRENYCAGCRYGEILDVLEGVADSLQQRLVLVGDPGCLVTVAERLDAKYAIGSAVGVADGLSKAEIDGRAVAIFGDSSFFHTTLSAICNAVYHRSDVLMIVLDNGATVTSGFQPNPGTGQDALGREAPRLEMEKIARACGVEIVRQVAWDEGESKLRQVFEEALSRRALALIVVRAPCVKLG
jgi:indolepyruvate ferredoxin oxidoreductase alpha subunit